MKRPTSPPRARSFNEVLTKLLRHNGVVQLRKIIERTHPADLAPVLPLLMDEDRRKILSLLNDSGKTAAVLLELDEEEFEEVIDSLDDPAVVAICRASAPDDAADLLDKLEETRREVILQLLGATAGANLEALLVGERDTAGSLMNTEYLALDQELTVANAMTAIREYPRKDAFFYVYTVDGDNHLVGVLSLRNLILSPPEATLRSIMVRQVVRTPLDATQEEVAQLVAKYDLLSVPVIDAQNHLVGVVTVDDVLDVIQEEAEEDLFHLAGVAVSDRISSTALTLFRARFPWLAVNLVTAFLAASVVRLYEGTIAQWAALAAFMPVVAGMGGNAGTQTLTVFVRGLAFGEINRREGTWPILKELTVGIANGCSMGLLTALVVGLWTGDWIMGAILFGAMLCNLIIAGVAGGIVPIVLKELGFDPAISSSIFVTTFTDVGGFFTFLGLATLALRYFR